MLGNLQFRALKADHEEAFGLGDLPAEGGFSARKLVENSDRLFGSGGAPFIEMDLWISHHEKGHVILPLLGPEERSVSEDEATESETTEGRTAGAPFEFYFFQISSSVRPLRASPLLRNTRRSFVTSTGVKLSLLAIFPVGVAGALTWSARAFQEPSSHPSIW